MILAIALVVVVMLQEGNERGLGAISGGADSFFSRHESSTPQAKLRKGTVFLGIAFVLATVVMGVLINLSVRG